MLAFLDIRPVHKGHTLLIPKEGYVWMQDVPDDLLAHCFVKTKMLMKAMKKTFECDFVHISIVGEEVPDFHIHINPRWLDDGLPRYPTLEYKSPKEEQEIAQKISDNIK